MQKTKLKKKIVSVGGDRLVCGWLSKHHPDFHAKFSIILDASPTHYSSRMHHPFDSS